MNEPSTSELIEGVLFYPIALVISATIFPGFTLCIPGLILATVLILLPLIAIAIVLLAAAAVVAAPILLVRAIRGRLASRSRAAVKPSTAVAIERPSRVGVAA
jgi:membrane protein implicated in regulation of membrane protease activity